MKQKHPITVVELSANGLARITKLTHKKGKWRAGLSVTTDKLTSFKRELIQRNQILKPIVMPLGDDE